MSPEIVMVAIADTLLKVEGNTNPLYGLAGRVAGVGEQGMST